MPSSRLRPSSRRDSSLPNRDGTPVLKRRGLRQRLVRLWRCAKRLCRRLDVCWSFIFLLLLLVTLTTSAVTQPLILKSLSNSLEDTHSIRIAGVMQRIANVNDRARYIAGGYFAIHLRRGSSVNDDDVVSHLCSTLDHTADQRFNRLFIYSLRLLEDAGCLRRSATASSPTVLGGFKSVNHALRYTYLVDNTSYRFVQPLQSLAEWPVERRNVSVTLPDFYARVPMAKYAEGYHNGSIRTIDSRMYWVTIPTLPHLFFYMLPLGIVGRGTPLQGDQDPNDFLLVGLDGTTLMNDYDMQSAGFSLAAFINTSLTQEDKLIFTNNWGQRSNTTYNIFSPVLNNTMSYVRVGDVSDPLMRAALEHVDFTAMQTTNYNRSIRFEYKGAYAIVTAITPLSPGGLVIPIVLVSAHRLLTPPYLTIFRWCNGIIGFTVVLFTTLFWWFVHNEYSRPLEDMTLLLLDHVRRGSRKMYKRTRCTFIQLSESAQLIRAFNDCMRRLRDIDAFIPRDVRQRFWLLRGQDPTTTTTTSTTTDMSRQESSVFVEMRTRLPSRHSNTLRPHHVTMAHVTVRAWTAHAEAEAAAAVAVAGGDAVALHGGGARRGQRLAAVVERAAHAGGVANSGAFASAAAVAAFSAAVHELAAQHGGLVRNLTPDGCVVHFMAAVCAHLPRHGGAERGGGPEYDPAPLRACIDADAYAGLAFALALQRWVDARSGADTAGTAAAAAAMPDVRCLVDTGVYTCGQYRAPGSEQTLTVALGRDAQRVVGRAAALLGVRVAMTEETAVRVRPGPRAATEPGVRQLPVEALRTGRAGLDADAVILYEVLPGAAAGDAAWLAYARCCFDGFECMVRGDYAGALRAYRGVGEIGDLEPGLLPRCLSREAAHSDAVGGAVSVQVQRMMRECERRVVAQDRSCFYRDTRSPYNVDIVLRAVPLEQRVKFGVTAGKPKRTESNGEAFVSGKGLRHRSHRVLSRPNSVRLISVVQTRAGAVWSVIGDKPDMVIDNVGCMWYISRLALEKSAQDLYGSHYIALGSAGSICIASFLPFREMHPMVAKVIADAPCGPMSNIMRSAVPVHDATAKQRRAVEDLFLGRHRLEHPNLLCFNAYSLSVEGGVVVMKNFAPGGTLREVQKRYSASSAKNLARFALGILSGLSYLHAKGCVHGSLSVDNVVIGADGQCRLRGYFTDYALAAATFLLPCTCYVSPAMAAGHTPTPACDMFCYGLLLLEALSGQPPWRWALDVHGATQGSEEELRVLLNEGGQRFCVAVTKGCIVPAVKVLELAFVRSEVDATTAAEVLRCLSPDPRHRPSAENMWNEAMRFLRVRGVVEV